MPDQEYILFQGEQYTIEWYYGSNGRSQALTYFSRLDRRQKIKLIKLVEIMGTIGVIRNKQQFNYEGDGVYAFKPQPDRFLCFFFRERKLL